MREFLEKHQVCYIEDSFVTNMFEGHSRWIVTLNSGFTVWQDDYRDGVNPPSAWERLGNYCRESGDYIVSMYIQFRSHREHLPENAKGYYFVKSILGSFHTQENFHFFVVGWSDGLPVGEDSVIVKVQEYKIPELIQISTEDRIVHKDDICLIRKL